SSLINTAVLLQWPAISHYLMEGVLFKKVGRGAARTTFPYGAYTAKDGDVITIFGQDDAEWPVVCSMLGIEHLLGDPRYDTIEKRNERKFELYPILDEAFSQKTRAEWAQIFREHKLRCDPCLDYAEFTAHPQFQENNLAIKVDDPRDGELRFPSTPVEFKKFPAKDTHKHAPILGEHTMEILQELGYTKPEIDELHDRGIIGLPSPDMFTVKRKLKGTAARRKGTVKGYHADKRRL
ncbi:CoA transferase, partial [Chloroflexota bacterium]